MRGDPKGEAYGDPRGDRMGDGSGDAMGDCSGDGNVGDGDLRRQLGEGGTERWRGERGVVGSCDRLVVDGKRMGRRGMGSVRVGLRPKWCSCGICTGGEDIMGSVSTQSLH